jgi:hyperosmotically inducible periplasmic protein
MRTNPAVCVLMATALTMMSISAVAGNGNAEVNPVVASATNIKQANRALQRSVRRALSRARGLNSTDIHVGARDGVITLQGSVPEARQIELATVVTRGVEGVLSVNNRLTVRQPSP